MYAELLTSLSCCVSSTAGKCPFLLRPYLSGLDGTFPKDGAASNDDTVLQQDLNSKPFFDNITIGGLQYTYDKYFGVNNPQLHSQTKHQKHVIIVGAGMAGLSAGFELSHSGHKVTILELQQRVGGRVKTIRQPFTKGLHAEGGAMRIPCTHYLTDHYLRLFEVKTRRFQNENTNAFYYFYGEKIKISDWNKNPGYYCDMFWPGWNTDVPKSYSESIKDIQSYWNETVKPVIEELQSDSSRLGWNKWVERWSQLSVQDFLKKDIGQGKECNLRPWPPIAIEAFRVQGYAPFLDASLVEFLRDDLGKWMEDPLHTPVEGMSVLPWAFTRKQSNGWYTDVDLSKDIQYGIKIQRVQVEESGEVQVIGRNVTTKQEVTFTGDAVILTVPLTVLRNMDVPLSLEKQRAIANVYYVPSTKILLQCKTRFWQRENNGGIQGGFSKTNLPIGQLHYPDFVGSHFTADDRGILLVYTWGQDSIIFGAQTDQEAIENAVNQIAKIHPEIVDEFEVGAVQAWFSDPAEQGAFANLRPDQFNEAITHLRQSDHPIYLAGEAISWSNGWIQGALESGLTAAFQFYLHNEDSSGQR